MEVKGLAWIGNIYEKFETMCLEMEEAMYEDTVKYVENQVQTVGATVKKFYSDVMQDLHPKSYIDPVKVAAADLSLNPYAHSEKKLKANAKKDGGETDWKSIDDSKVISGKANTGVYRRPVASRRGGSKDNLAPLPPSPIAPIAETSNSLSSFSQLKRSREVAPYRADVVFPSAHLEGGSRNTNGKFSKPLVAAVLPKSYATVKSPANATIRSAVSTEQKQDNSVSTKVDSPATGATTSSAASTGIKQADSASTSSPGCLSSESSDASTYVKNGVGSQSGGPIYNETDNGKFFGEDRITVHQGRLDGGSMDADKNDNAIDSEVEIIEPFNEPILEETCVMVEGDKLHAVPQGKGSRKSYKKKLREAFSSKMRLTKEYEQLAAKYIEEESDEESAERVSPDHPENASVEILPAHSSESEWELL